MKLGQSDRLGRTWQALSNLAHTESTRVAEYLDKISDRHDHLLAMGETVHHGDLSRGRSKPSRRGVDASSLRCGQRKSRHQMVHDHCSRGLGRDRWAGSLIPIFPVYGNETYVKGKRVHESVIRYAKGRSSSSISCALPRRKRSGLPARPGSWPRARSRITTTFGKRRTEESRLSPPQATVYCGTLVRPRSARHSSPRPSDYGGVCDGCRRH